MFELFTDYSLSLLNEVTNPQKRVFAGALVIAGDDDFTSGYIFWETINQVLENVSIL